MPQRKGSAGRLRRRPVGIGALHARVEWSAKMALLPHAVECCADGWDCADGWSADGPDLQGERRAVMSVLEGTSLVWVVLDRLGDVVVMYTGADAAEACEDWVARGYRTVCLGADEVTPA